MFEKDPAEFLVTGEAVVTLGDLVEGQVFQVLLQEPPAGIYNSNYFCGNVTGVKSAMPFFVSQARSVPTRGRPRPGSRSNCPRKTWNFGAANCRKELESSQFPDL